MKTIGIDIGTTSISASLIDTEHLEQDVSCSIPNSNFLKGESWESLQDPAQIISKAKQLLDRQLEIYPDICAIGLTGQMHGMLYTDKNGRHVSPLYTWQDGRGNRMLSDGKTICGLLQEEYGRKIYTGYGLATHVYHMYSGLVPEAASSFCTIPDYFGMCITGRKVPLIHSSMAASMGVYDTNSQAPDFPLLKALGLPESFYPTITLNFLSIGSYKGIPVCVAIGDNQASFLGSVDDLQNTVLLNMGTGGQVSVLSKTSFTAEGIEARPLWRSYFILAGSSLCGGRAYAMLRDFFQSYAEAMGITDVDHYSVMNRLLKKDITQDSLKVSTLFAGTRENPHIRGTIENISTENFTPTALIAGILDGMTDELYQYYLLMKNGIGKSFGILKASGNGIRKNSVLQKKVSERFGIPLSLTAYGEEAARGAAKTALISADIFSPSSLLGIK